MPNIDDSQSDQHVTTSECEAGHISGQDVASADEKNVAAAQEGAGQLGNELQQAQDRVLRAQAELENFRKRARRDMDEQRRYASLTLLRDLLPVVDNFDRALAALDSNEHSTELREGVKMVATQLRMVLEQHNCQPINAEGETFDPTFHEAIAQEPSDEHPPGTVIRVPQIGYRIHDRVIRPSHVVVSSGPQNVPEDD